MRRVFILLCLALLASLAISETPKAASPAPTSATPGTKADLAPPQVVPVRKVVLYKNGVGYFEHSGSVSGNQRVSIDFTSAQLNDVLQSLTVLDEGGGRIGGVNYNSTTPLAEQLKTLSLGMTDDPTSTELFAALRGQRVEITGGTASNGGGGAITGRLMSIESRTEKIGTGDNSSTVDKFYLTLVAASGAVRVLELTRALSVRPLDVNLQGQLDRYLELLGSAHANGLRHLTLNAIGQGHRELRVSYISEVPVWKSTYRIVFPRAASGEGLNAIVQGWAVVDNTVGADWDSVQLALVAGAPQSFIQPLSQPLYTRRPEIPISTAAQTTPQTHEAAENAGPGAISGTVTDVTGAVVANATVTATAAGTNAEATGSTSGDGQYNIGPLPPGLYTLTVTSTGFSNYVQRNLVVSGQTKTVNVRLNVGSASETVEVRSENRNFAQLAMAPPSAASKAVHGVGAGSGNGYGPGSGGGTGGGTYRTSDAFSAGDVSTNAFDDFFEYSLTQPVTIHKNESAMVPILQQELPAEHVTLWSDKERNPLRALWLENKSKLTLDAGSFSIFESGEFAGEGLLDPIHPGEKRLLSYAVDQAVRVRRGGFADTRTLHHVAMRQGVLVETTSEVSESTYTVTNGADEVRTVIVEHARRANAELDTKSDSAPKPEETTATAYRFRVVVKPHESADLHVGERANLSERIVLNALQFRSDYIISLSKYAPNLEDKLKPLIDAETALSDLDRRIADLQQKEKILSDDEARVRDNVAALKNNDAAKRFVDELNHAEDDLQAARKERTGLEKGRDAARKHLDDLIAQVSFDTDLSVVTQSTQFGNRPPQN